MCVSYHCICLTDFVEKAETKFLVGYSLMATTGVNIVIGISHVLFVVLK